MKKLITIAAAVVAAAVAVPAFAGTINAEVRLGDIRGGQKPNSTEYNVVYAAPLTNSLDYGAEVTVRQANGAGNVNADVAARVGPRLPTFLGFQSQAYGEVGQRLAAGDDYLFWGAGIQTSHRLVGPVNVAFGYRHRGAFNDNTRLNENRLNAGLSADVGHGNTVGVQYYRTTGTVRSDAVGLGITHSF